MYIDVILYLFTINEHFLNFVFFVLCFLNNFVSYEYLNFLLIHSFGEAIKYFLLQIIEIFEPKTL